MSTLALPMNPQPSSHRGSRSALQPRQCACRPAALFSALLVTASFSLIAMGGCAQLLGFDDVSEQQSIADAASVDSTPAPDADLRFACTSSELSPELGTTTINTESQNNELTLSCGAGEAGDLQFAWQAPITDYYVFDTQGSSFDTVIALFDQCDGTELACNNNSGEDSSSKLVRKFERDEEIVVAVDGNLGDQGAGQLNVTRVSCPDADLEGQPLPAELSTVGFGDEFSNSCGGATFEDRAYHWVAPSDGLFAFEATAAGFSPIISVLGGPECSDTELGCGKAQSAGRHAEVARRLQEGEQISLYLDGVDGAGAVTLDVIDRSGLACPDETLPLGDSRVGTYTARTMSPSCGFPEFSGPFGETVSQGDRSYGFELGAIGEGCNGGCTVQIESAGAFAVSLLDQSDCGGHELACEFATFDGVNYTASIDMGLGLEALPRTLIVSGQDNLLMAETFTISMSCGLVC